MIADTDVLIDFLTDREPAAERVAGLLAAGALATTSVSRPTARPPTRPHRSAATCGPAAKTSAWPTR